MTQSVVSQTLVAQLQQCLALTHNIANHTEATDDFKALRDRIAATHPQTAELLDAMWNEVLASRRSATFWQEICNVEKELSERIAANNVQLRQNYQRLIQEH